MKHGVKATYQQRKLIQKLSKLDTHNILVIKDTPTEIWVKDRTGDDSVIILYKDGSHNV